LWRRAPLGLVDQFAHRVVVLLTIADVVAHLLALVVELLLQALALRIPPQADAQPAGGEDAKNRSQNDQTG